MLPLSPSDLIATLGVEDNEPKKASVRETSNTDSSIALRVLEAFLLNLTPAFSAWATATTGASLDEATDSVTAAPSVNVPIGEW